MHLINKHAVKYRSWSIKMKIAKITNFYNIRILTYFVTLKTKDCKFDNIVFTGGTMSCHNDNFGYQQWR